MADKKPHLVLLKNGADSPKKIPIVIVPGMAIFYGGNNWKRILERNGYPSEIANFYIILATKTIDEQARILFREIEKILALHRAEKCHLLAFSMGGIVALHFLQRYDARKRVEKCICVSAPFYGIRRYLSALIPFKILVRGLPEIIKGNGLLKSIVKGAATVAVKVYTIRGNADWLCGESPCRLPFAENLPPIDGGHLSICSGLNEHSVNQALRILAG